MSLVEIKREELKSRIFHCPDIQKFSADTATKEIIYETEHSVGAVWTMLPGQTLPIHSHVNADDIWIVVEGVAEYYPETGQKVQIKKGDMVVARPGEKHGMTNVSDEPFVMLGIAGPVPIGFVPHSAEAEAFMNPGPAPVK